MSDRDLIARLATALRVQLDGVNLYSDLLAEADAHQGKPGGGAMSAYRDALADLLEWAVWHCGHPGPAAVSRARALLAEAQPQPVEWQGNSSAILTSSQAKPVEPTDEELLSLRSWSSHGPTFDSDLVAFARAVLARWGRPAPEPVKPSEQIASIAVQALECALAWEPDARLIGNVRAEDIADLCNAVIAGLRPAPEPVSVAELPWHALPVPQEQADV